MFQEVIVCDQCGAEGCTVREITALPKLTMSEFATKHGDVPGKTQAQEVHQRAQNRAFELKCLRCGHTQRFQPGKPFKKEKPDRKPDRPPPRKKTGKL